jgi:outer membrane protein assembly factor BamA
MLWRATLSTIAALVGATPAHATEATSKSALTTPQTDQAGWIALPVIGYAPETSVQLGAYAMRYFHFDAKSPRSTVGGMASGTLKKQVLVELKPNFYFGEGAYRLEAHFELQRFPDNFYGIGNDAQHSAAEKYERRLLRLSTNFRRRVHGSFHVGMALEQSSVTIDVKEPDGLLVNRDYWGERGGICSGLGVVATFDDRNDHAFTTSGFFFEAKQLTFLPAFGSDYRFSRTGFDTRYFLRTGPRRALAFRYLLEVGGGRLPFYQLPTFGGANSLRGYYWGKYRDSLAHALEAEYRARLWWRLGATVFAGAGQVAPRPSALASSPLRPSVGGGLRFDLSGTDGFNLRMDLGGWPGDVGFYMAVLEAF